MSNISSAIEETEYDLLTGQMSDETLEGAAAAERGISPTMPSPTLDWSAGCCRTA